MFSFQVKGLRIPRQGNVILERGTTRFSRSFTNKSEICFLRERRLSQLRDVPVTLILILILALVMMTMKTMIVKWNKK